MAEDINVGDKVIIEDCGFTYPAYSDFIFKEHISEIGAKYLSYWKYGITAPSANGFNDTVYTTVCLGTVSTDRETEVAYIVNEGTKEGYIIATKGLRKAKWFEQSVEQFFDLPLPEVVAKMKEGYAPVVQAIIEDYLQSTFRV